MFGIDYDAIDMADLIPQATTRALVKQATAGESTGNRTEAMALLSDARSKTCSISMRRRTAIRPHRSRSALTSDIRCAKATSAGLCPTTGWATPAG